MQWPRPRPVPGELKEGAAGEELYHVMPGQDAGDNGFGVAYQEACLFTGTEQVGPLVRLQAVAPSAHCKIAHGVALAPCIWVFITGAFKSGNLMKLFQRVIGSHHFGVSGVQKDDVFGKFIYGILLAGLDGKMVFHQFPGKGDDDHAIII